MDEAAGVGGTRTLAFEGLVDWYRMAGGEIKGPILWLAVANWLGLKP